MKVSYFIFLWDWDIEKQCRPRSDAAKCDVSSAFRADYVLLKSDLKKKKKIPPIPIDESWKFQLYELHKRNI